MTTDILVVLSFLFFFSSIDAVSEQHFESTNKKNSLLKMRRKKRNEERCRVVVTVEDSTNVDNRRKTNDRPFPNAIHRSNDSMANCSELKNKFENDSFFSSSIDLLSVDVPSSNDVLCKRVYS